MTTNATSHNTHPRSAFFGSDEFSVLCLEEMKRNEYIPDLVITNEDKPKGRKQILTPTPVKVWAKQHNIPVLQPHTLDATTVDQIREHSWDVFIVASYGKILPAALLEVPAQGTLNIHPSLLPRWRGAAPIQNAILYDNGTGVTIMKMDEQMDHGPIVTQKRVPVTDWPPQKAVLEAILAREGAHLLCDVLPDYLNGSLTPDPQDHDNAVYCSKITKQDAYIDFDDSDKWNYRKIQAFHEWPRPYFFVEKNGKELRVIITDAELSPEGQLVINTVIPEGKQEMSYEDFRRGFLQ